jgi:hypothetical protein
MVLLEHSLTYAKQLVTHTALQHFYASLHSFPPISVGIAWWRSRQVCPSISANSESNSVLFEVSATNPKSSQNPYKTHHILKIS